MEKSCTGSGGTLALINPQSRAIAKKTSFHCINVAQMHLDSCATENDADADDIAACKNASAVRVVQIFNPVLVKTDVANFRLLVQKLTGKSGCSKYVWNKLRRLNYGAAMDELQLQELNVLGAAGGGHMHDVSKQNIPDPAGDDDDVEGRGAGGGAFSELDIYAGLVSDGPLPDITMLPPLLNIHHHHTRSEVLSL